MKPNKRLAAGLAGVLAIAGVSALATGGSPAQAANVNYSGTSNIVCHLYFASGLPGTPAGDASLQSSNSVLQWSTLTQSPAGPVAVGQLVTVTATSPGLTNGPVALVAGATQISGTAVISGAQSGTVALTTPALASPRYPGGNYPAGTAIAPYDVPSGSTIIDPNLPLGAISVSGTYTATATGTNTVALKTFQDLDLSGSGANNYCDGTSAGTGTFPGLTNTAGWNWSSTNISGLNIGAGTTTTGFYVSRVANAAYSWAVPTSWDPLNAPAASPSILSTIDVNGPAGTVARVVNPGADGNVSTALAGAAGGDDTIIAPGTGGVNYVRSSDVLYTTGNSFWGATGTVATAVSYTVCPDGFPAAFGGSGCSPGGVNIAVPTGFTGGVAANVDLATGQLQTVAGTASILKIQNLSGFTGLYSLVLHHSATYGAGTDYAFAQTARINILGNRTISGPATVNIGGNSAVTGSNFYPGETVSLTSTAADDVSGAITGTIKTAGVATITATNDFVVGDRVVITAGGSNIASAYLGGVVVTAATPTSFNFVIGASGATAAATPTAGAIATKVDGLPSLGATSTVTATGTGSFSGNVVVSNAAAKEFKASGIANAGGQNYVPTGAVLGTLSGVGTANSTAFTINPDRCVAYSGNLTGGPGCYTTQTVTAVITAGQLTQRAYQTGINASATVVDMGSITSPLATTTIGGTMNDITVSDNRGGTYGWSLTATMPNFTGALGNNIANSKLAVAPTCALSSNATAWDYSAVGKTAIAGFDATLNAPGVTAGGSQNFGGTVTLCTKSTAVNATTLSSGGVYNITGPLTLTVDAFKAADTYTSTITVTLA